MLLGFVPSLLCRSSISVVSPAAHSLATLNALSVAGYRYSFIPFLSIASVLPPTSLLASCSSDFEGESSSSSPIFGCSFTWASEQHRGLSWRGKWRGCASCTTESKSCSCPSIQSSSTANASCHACSIVILAICLIFCSYFVFCSSWYSFLLSCLLGFSLMIVSLCSRPTSYSSISAHNFPEFC